MPDILKMIKLLVFKIVQLKIQVYNFNRIKYFNNKLILYISGTCSDTINFICLLGVVFYNDFNNKSYFFF